MVIVRDGSVEALLWVRVSVWVTVTEPRVGEVVLERVEGNEGGFRVVMSCDRAWGRVAGGGIMLMETVLNGV